MRLAGRGIAGGGQGGLASTRAGWDAGTCAPTLAPELPASGGLVAFAAAVKGMVAGEVQRACVSSAGGTVSVATLLERMKT